jgi:hypothetical protein
MSTTALNVDSRERAPPPEQSVLDLATALKVSEEISGEMVLERLIEKALRAAIEHAGAQRGLLIVPKGDGLHIEAEAMAIGEGVTVCLAESVGGAALPESVLGSVMRTQQAVHVAGLRGRCRVPRARKRPL